MKSQKYIDANWLRSKEDRLLNQSDVLTQRLADLGNNEDEKQSNQYTAYHGIGAPKRKLMESQILLIKMRKAHQDEAIARHHRTRAIMRYIEAWRVTTIRRCHYLACKRRAKRHRLQIVLTKMLQRCVFTCKFRHAISVIDRQREFMQCRQAMDRFQLFVRLSRRYSLAKRTASPGRLAWQRWRARFFSLLDTRYSQMTLLIRAYRFRLYHCAKPALRILYNRVKNRRGRHSKVAAAIPGNSHRARSHEGNVENLMELHRSHNIARIIHRWRTYLYWQFQYQADLTAAGKHRTLHFLRKWRRHCVSMKRPMLLQNGHVRQGSRLGRAMGYRDTLLIRYMEKFMQYCMYRRSMRRRNMASEKYSQQRLMQSALKRMKSFARHSHVISRDASKVVAKSRFGKVAVCSAALQVWKSRIVVCKGLNRSLLKSTRYVNNIDMRSGWSLWMQRRKQQSDQRQSYDNGRSQFAQSAVHRFFRFYSVWQSAVEHHRGMEQIGYFHWRRRACVNVLVAIALRVHAAKDPSTTRKQKHRDRHHTRRHSTPGLKLAYQHFFNRSGASVIKRLRNCLQEKMANRILKNRACIFHNRFQGRAALAQISEYFKKSQIFFKMDEASARGLYIRRLRKGLGAFASSLGEQSAVQMRLSVPDSHHKSRKLSVTLAQWITWYRDVVRRTRYHVIAAQHFHRTCQKRQLRKWLHRCRFLSVMRDNRYSMFHLKRLQQVALTRLNRSSSFPKKVVAVLVPKQLVMVRDLTATQRQQTYWMSRCDQCLFSFYAKNIRAVLWRNYKVWVARRHQLVALFHVFSDVRNLKLKRRVFAALLWNTVDETKNNSVLKLGISYHKRQMQMKYFSQLMLRRSVSVHRQQQNNGIVMHMARYWTARNFRSWRDQLTQKYHKRHQLAEMIIGVLKHKYLRKLSTNVKIRKLHRNEGECYAVRRTRVACRASLTALKQHSEYRHDLKVFLRGALNHYIRLFLLRFVYNMNVKKMYTKMKKGWLLQWSKGRMKRMLIKWKALLNGNQSSLMDASYGLKSQRYRLQFAASMRSNRMLQGAWSELKLLYALRVRIAMGKQHFSAYVQRKSLRKLDRAVYLRKQRMRHFAEVMSARKLHFLSKKRKGIRWLHRNAQLNQLGRMASRIIVRRYFKFFESYRTGRRLTRLALTNLTTRSERRMRRVFNTWKEDTAVERILDTALWRKTCYQKYVVLSHWRQLITWKREDRDYKTHMISVFMEKQEVIFMKVFFRRLGRLVRDRKSNRRMEKRAAKALMYHFYQCTSFLRNQRKKHQAVVHKADKYYYKSLLSLGFRYLLYKVTSKRLASRVLFFNDRRHNNNMLRSAFHYLWFRAAQARKLRALNRKLAAYVVRRKKLITLQIMDGRVCTKWASEESTRLLDMKCRKMALMRGIKCLFHHARHQNYRRRRRAFNEL